MLDWVPRRVRFVNAAVHPVQFARRFVSVRLEHRSGEPYVGRVGDGASGAEELRHAAEAALDAIRQVVGSDTNLVLQGVASLAAVEHSFIVAIVSVTHDHRTQTLMGICPLSMKPARDAALAVLSATNRFLGLG